MKMTQLASLVLFGISSLATAGCSSAGGNSESQANATNKGATAKTDSPATSQTQLPQTTTQANPAPSVSLPAAPLPVVSSPAENAPLEKEPIITPAKAVELTEKPAATAISLAVVTRPQFDERIAAYKGKVIFVDCWATWCDVCLKEFPHTVDLHKKYAKDGLQVISLSMDDTGDHTKALDELMSQGATFLNLRSSYGGSEESFTKYDIPSGLPHMMVFDRTGKLRKSFASDAIDHKEIEKFVQELLSEK